jgi:hypothetical protein
MQRSLQKKIRSDLSRQLSMSFESRYWKEEIKRDISFIEKTVNSDLTLLSDHKFESLMSKLEIKTFTLAYAFRKLIENRKVEQKLFKKSIKVTSYKFNGRVAPFYNLSFERSYDLKNAETDTLEAGRVCNMIIHSFVFQFSFYGKRVVYLFLNSDKSKKKCVYRIKIKDLITLFEKASNSYPSKMSLRYSAELNDYVYSEE